MGRLKPAGFFALRTPLLPLSTFTGWGEGAARLRADDEDARRALRTELARRLECPAVREALFVASPDLDAAVAAWETDPSSDKGARAERALVRYFARMASRPTPFGLFAGLSTGVLSATAGGDGVELPATGENRRVTRLDMEYVAALVAALERAPEVRARLSYRPNSSLYRAAGRVRYVESVLAERSRQHRLVAIEDSPYLSRLLEVAGRGARIDELAATLVDEEVTLEEAAAFVSEVVDAQLLVSDLEPTLTGSDPVPCLAARLEQLGLGDAARILEEAVARLRDLDSGLVAGRPAYVEVATILEPLPAPVSLPRLFQVDMVKPAVRAELGPRVTEELARAARLLHDFLPAPVDTPLDRFRERFLARYEDRLVPLDEVLDEELGIGFETSQAPSAEASPLLRDLSFGGGPAAPAVRWTPARELITRKVTAALQAGENELHLSPAEVASVAHPDRPPLPGAFAVTASIAAASEEALRAGDFRLLVHAVVGPSGARMLGRFCHADPALETAVREHLAAEARVEQDAVFAEVVHLPEGRIGNVASRPAMRDYEIPYLGQSSLPPDRQLPVADLRVGVRDNLVILWSERLGKRVLPRLTTAHNYGPRNIGMYRFLCALQDQGVHGQLMWDWGTLAPAPFLPRVVSGRLVLSRRRWRLDKDQVSALQAPTPAARHHALRELAAAIGLPDLFVLADFDNELLTDLANPVSAETFAQLVARRPEAVLFELFPGPDQLWVQGPEGRFTSEVIVPFQVEPTQATAADQPSRDRGRDVAVAPTRDAARLRFPPGTEWLYAKLYAGTSTVDTLLRDLVAPLVRREQADGVVDRWFFIRYGDPDWHLRLRLHGEPGRLAGLLPRLSRAAAPMLEDGRVSNLVLDTYEPEVARYGGPAALPLAEQLFHVDSEAVLSIVELLSGDEGMDARWRLTMRGADMLLDDLGLDLAQKRALARRLRDSYRAEFQAGGRLHGQVGDRFRKESRALRTLLARDDDGSSLAPGFEILAERSLRSREAAEGLSRLAAAGELSVSVPELAASLVHMHANRLLRSAHRAQELVIYDFLDRLYLSAMERR